MCAIPSIFRSSCSPGTASSRLTTLPLGDLQRKLAWDAASRLVQQDDVPTAGATESRRFGYDRLDRLLSQDVDASPSATNTQQFRYSWDLAGNRSTYSYKDGTGSWTYTHSTPSSSNRLASVTGSTGKLSYTYDEAGNPKGDGDKNYTWRASGWLDSLTRNGLTTRYAYNGFAQRVAKLSGSTPNTSADTRLYTYDEAGHLLGEYTATGQLIQEHVWLGDTPIALIDAQGVKLVFADQLDTPRRITDTTGKALWKWNGEAFGLTLPNEDADGDGKTLTYNLRFPGQVFDKESNLHYNWHRYYDPGTGRYVSSDPIGLDGGINTYLYADGSPTTRTDPLGLKTFMCTMPLHALGGEGARSGWDVPGNPLYHQYLCINDGKGGYTCGGQDQRGQKWYDPITGPGKPSDDKYDPQTCEQKEPDNNCIEQCLLKKFAGPRPRYGIPFGTDCQEWSDDALKDCQKQCKKK